MKLAFVVPRYGTELADGPEHLCRLVAERLAVDHEVDVLTTCARDGATWENALPEGADRVRGVAVRRFANDGVRDADIFARLTAKVQSHPHSRTEEMDWLKQLGPWSPSLIDHIRRQHQQYDNVVFFGYRSASTVMGLDAAPQRSVLVPLAQDDSLIHLEVFTQLFAKAGALCYTSESEAAFISRRFPDRTLIEEVVGLAVELPQHQTYPRMTAPEDSALIEDGGAAPAATSDEPPGRPEFPPHLTSRGTVFRRRHRLNGPFVLLGGHVAAGSGCEELIEYFSRYVARGGTAVLTLLGATLMPLPQEPFLRFAGMLPDRERLEALEAATVVVCPDPEEGLTTAALEALSVGTPILASARSAVLVEHCVRSNGGLYYEDGDEFVECLTRLLDDAPLRAAMSRNGRSYIRQHHRWDTVLGQYKRLFGKLRHAR